MRSVSSGESMVKRWHMGALPSVGLFAVRVGNTIILPMIAAADNAFPPPGACAPATPPGVLLAAADAPAAAAPGAPAANASDASGAPAPAHFMYVLECVDGSLYTGYAVDVQRRLEAHNAGRGAKYTRARRPVTLLAYAGFATKHDAMSAEYRFKQLSRDEKDALLAQAARTSLEEALAPLLA